MRSTWGLAAALVVACGSDDTTTSPSPSSSSSSSTSSGSTSSTSSSSGDTSCPDCGGCGIAGPVDVDAMVVTSVGVDTAGRAAVALDLEKAGECRGRNQAPSTLHVLSDGAFDVTVGAETLDRTKVTTQGASYVWSDRDLSLAVDNAGTAGLTLAFTKAGAPLFRAKCLPTGASGSCTKE